MIQGFSPIARQLTNELPKCLVKVKCLVIGCSTLLSQLVIKTCVIYVHENPIKYKLTFIEYRLVFLMQITFCGATNYLHITYNNIMLHYVIIFLVVGILNLANHIELFILSFFIFPLFLIVVLSYK
jgi:hypothetical protein